MHNFLLRVVHREVLSVLSVGFLRFFSLGRNKHPQVIEARQLAEDHGGMTGSIPHSGARLVVRMVRGLLERDGERLKVLISFYFFVFTPFPLPPLSLVFPTRRFWSGSSSDSPRTIRGRGGEGAAIPTPGTHNIPPPISCCITTRLQRISRR